LPVGKVMIVACATARELDSATVTAYAARKEMRSENPDAIFEISRSAVQNRVTISRVR